MRPRLVPKSRKCRDGLKAGEFKRVPKRYDFPAIAFHFACPTCGFSRPVQTKAIDEGGHEVIEVGNAIKVMRPAVTCIKCCCEFSIEDGQYVIKLRGSE